MFVVVLVVTLLTALGVFAVRSSALANRASGYNRQLSQVHFVTDFAVNQAVADVGVNPEAAKQQMMAGADVAAGHVKCAVHDALVSNSIQPTCWQRSYDDLEQQVSATGENLLRADSLGSSAVDADMKVELTDLHPALPVKGNEIAGGADANNQQMFVYVTITASGLVRPKQAVANTWDTASATAAGQELSRAHIFMGPVLMQR